MFHNITEGVPVQFSLDHGLVRITFSDPAYVRSDVIIFNRKDCSLHAVLNEGLHLIARIDGDLTKTFASTSEVVLAAPHYYSGAINLKIPLVVKN